MSPQATQASASVKDRLEELRKSRPPQDFAILQTYGSGPQKNAFASTTTATTGGGIYPSIPSAQGRPGAPQQPPPSPIDSDGLLLDMPTFYSQCSQLKENNALIARLGAEIEHRHRQALSSGSIEESASASQEISVLTAKVNTILDRNRTLIQVIGTKNAELESMAPRGSGYLRQRLVNHQQLGQQFLKVSKDFQRMQNSFKEKYINQVQRQYKVVNPDASLEELATLASEMDSTGASAKQQIYALAVKEDARAELAKMKNRMRDMETLVHNLQTLAALFYEMQGLVMSQGELINRIGYNMEHVEEYTVTAAQSLENAVHSQKSIQKKKWLMVVLGIFVFVLVIIVLYFMFGRGMYGGYGGYMGGW